MSGEVYDSVSEGYGTTVSSVKPIPSEAIDKLETQMKPLREEIKKALNREFLLLAYNLKFPEGIIESDSTLLMDFMDNNKNPNLTIILHGGGGDFATGVLMAHILRKLNYFHTYVPKLCCSAMCCMFLKSDKLSVSGNSEISQIDPVFQLGDRWFRAIKEIHSLDTVLKENSRRVFNFAEDHVIALIKDKPSLLAKDMEFDKFGHTTEFVTTFMNKGTHSTIVKYQEMVDLDLNVEMNSDITLLQKSCDLIGLCEAFLEAGNKRMIMVSSAPIEKAETGHFIIPDQ